MLRFFSYMVKKVEMMKFAQQFQQLKLIQIINPRFFLLKVKLLKFNSQTALSSKSIRIL